MAIALLSLLPACAPRLIPTPVAFGPGGGDPFASAPAEVRRADLPIIVVSSAEPNPDFKDPRDAFTNQRSTSLWAGVATVRIGEPAANWSDLAALSTASPRPQDVPVRVIDYHPFGPIARRSPPAGFRFDQFLPAGQGDADALTDFLQAVQTQLDAGGSGRVLVLVHGFNNSLERHLLTVAQHWHYLGQRGVCIAFHWPSAQGLFQYPVDKQNAAYATRYFRQLLRLLALHSGVERIDIVAHSAGAPVAINALRELRLMNFDAAPDSLQARTKIGRVVLAAPDVDLLEFENALMDSFELVSDQITIYSAPKDLALAAAEWLVGFARLGQSAQKLELRNRELLQQHPKVHLIDADRAVKTFPDILGHGYHRDNPWVVSDIQLLLRGLDPAQRGLAPEPHSDGVVWEFPTDYPNLARQAALRLSLPTTAAANTPAAPGPPASAAPAPAASPSPSPAAPPASEAGTSVKPAGRP